MARLPRVREALIAELVRGVLMSDEVQLAAAVLRAEHPDARLTLALRLCDVVDPAVFAQEVLTATEGT